MLHEFHRRQGEQKVSATYLVMGRSGTKAGAGGMEVYTRMGVSFVFAGVFNLLTRLSLHVQSLQDLPIFDFPVNLWLASFMLFFVLLLMGASCCIPRIHVVVVAVVFLFQGEARAGGGFGQHPEGSRNRHLGPRVQRAGGVSLSAGRRFHPGEADKRRQRPRLLYKLSQT